MPTEASYITQFRAEMSRILPTRSRREADAFAALDVHEQAWRFMNWQTRRVHPHPRQVNKANGFDDQPAVKANRQRVEALLAGITRGDDVNGHLSHDVEQGYCLHRPGQKYGPDFDLLLNEWGIHHLHLEQAPGKPGYRARTKDLLYVILRPGVAFVLAVASHGAWTNRRFIELTIKSWPDQRLFLPLNLLPGRDWSEDQRQGLRKAGLTTAAVVNDQCWVSGVTLGISTALVSTRVSKETGHLLRCIYQAEEHPEHVNRQIMNCAALHGLTWPTEPNIRIRWLPSPDRYCFAFVEETSSATIFINTAL